MNWERIELTKSSVEEAKLRVKKQLSKLNSDDLLHASTEMAWGMMRARAVAQFCGLDLRDFLLMTIDDWTTASGEARKEDALKQLQRGQEKESLKLDLEDHAKKGPKPYSLPPIIG